MVDTVYSKSQIDAILAIVGNRITVETDIPTLKANIGAISDTNFLTDAEKTKIASLESSKFLGTFTSVGNIPTVNAVAGSYADVDAGVGSDVSRYIWDVDDASFVEQGGAVAGETATSIKTKYESNADTNALTDALLTKLNDLSLAANTNDAVAALDGAIT